MLVFCDFTHCGTRHGVCQPDQSSGEGCCLPGAWIHGVMERLSQLSSLSDCFLGNSSRQASVKWPGKAVSRLKVTAGLWGQREEGQVSEWQAPQCSHVRCENLLRAQEKIILLCKKIRDF